MVRCLPLDDAFEVFLPVTTKTHAPPATCISFIVEYMMCDVWLIPYTTAGARGAQGSPCKGLVNQLVATAGERVEDGRTPRKSKLRCACAADAQTSFSFLMWTWKPSFSKPTTAFFLTSSTHLSVRRCLAETCVRLRFNGKNFGGTFQLWNRSTTTSMATQQQWDLARERARVEEVLQHVSRVCSPCRDMKVSHRGFVCCIARMGSILERACISSCPPPSLPSSTGGVFGLPLR